MTLSDILKRTTECGDCLLWAGSCNGRGQPKVHNGSARRRVYELAHGPVPVGKRISVDCDQVKCLNPEHLVAVTVSKISTITNARHDVKLKRQASSAKTNRPKLGKITIEIARELRNSDRPGIELARELGVSTSLISRVRCGRSWVEHSHPFAGLLT